jgi:anthranilate synthase/aminodeoxychorismate synthase-like glutamine amidotransferase
MASGGCVVIVDNHDSFTWNIVDEFACRGAAVKVVSNRMEAAGVIAKAGGRGAGLLIISPGPGSPADAGCSAAVVLAAEALRIPLLGICLGLQVLVEALGGRVSRSGRPVHGRPSTIHHDGGAPFDNLPSPLLAGRYHSLAAVSLPPTLRQTASSGGVVMAVRHTSAPMIGVQFHPESILTTEGGRIMANVLDWSRRVAV